MRRLRPWKMYVTLFDIDLQEVRSAGIKGIILDIDNTIIPWGSEGVSRELSLWVEKAVADGFKICLVSNAGGRRARKIGEKLSLPTVAPAKKPMKSAFRSGIALIGLDPGEVVVIGDQLFTDVMGGNRAGMRTILVNPVSVRELWATRFIRIVERLILKRPA